MKENITDYSDYIAEKIDSIIEYNDYLAEMVNGINYNVYKKSKYQLKREERTKKYSKLFK